MTANRNPVRVNLYVEGFGDRAVVTYVIGRDEWEAMTAEEQEETLNVATEELLCRHVTSGWEVEPPDHIGRTR